MRSATQIHPDNKIQGLYPHYKSYCEVALKFMERQHVPYVNIRVTNEGLTSDKKAQLISGVTDLLKTILGKNPETTVVIIDEVHTDNWGIGGETVSVRRARESKGANPR